jgi:hypothetical protein
MDGFAFFPAIVYRDEKPELVSHISSIVNKYYNYTKQNSQIEQSESQVIQTENLFNDPSLSFFVDYLISSGINILEDQGYNTSKYNFYLSSFWGQEVNKSGGTNIHVHKNSQISGWYFLETPIDGSYPIFYDSRMNKAMVELDYEQDKEILNASSIVHFKDVKPGTIFFSNSWLQHQLSVNLSNSPTRAIHFVISHHDKVPTCNII